jgi:choline-glycine betaine transporter
MSPSELPAILVFVNTLHHAYIMTILLYITRAFSADSLFLNDTNSVYIFNPGAYYIYTTKIAYEFPLYINFSRYTLTYD